MLVPQCGTKTDRFFSQKFAYSTSYIYFAYSQIYTQKDEMEQSVPWASVEILEMW